MLVGPLRSSCELRALSSCPQNTSALLFLKVLMDGAQQEPSTIITSCGHTGSYCSLLCKCWAHVQKLRCFEPIPIPSNHSTKLWGGARWAVWQQGTHLSHLPVLSQDAGQIFSVTHNRTYAMVSFSLGNRSQHHVKCHHCPPWRLSTVRLRAHSTLAVAWLW